MNRIETTALKMHGDKTIMSIRSFLTSAARAAVKAGVILSKQAENIADNRDEVVSCLKELSDATHGIKMVAVDMVVLGVQTARHVTTELKAAGKLVADIDNMGDQAMNKLMTIINRGVEGGQGEGAVGEGQGGVGGGQGAGEGQGGVGGGQGEGAGEGGGQGGQGDVESEWGYVGGLQGGVGGDVSEGLTWDQNPRLREVVRMASGLREDLEQFAEVHQFELIIVKTVGGVIKAARYVAYKVGREGYKVAADRLRDRAKYIETYSEGLYNDHKL